MAIKIQKQIEESIIENICILEMTTIIDRFQPRPRSNFKK